MEKLQVHRTSDVLRVMMAYRSSGKQGGAGSH
jgi:hypothetical protein